MEWATDKLYADIKRIIRKLDDGNKNLNAFSAAVKERLEAENILKIVYKNGAEIPLDKYANMLARSSRSETVNIAGIERGAAAGTDLVKCATIFPTCALCAEFQGRVYSVSGNDKRFPALFDTALKHGYMLIHPNCRHEFIPYFEELQPPGALRKDIERSSRPFKDSREAKEREAYTKWQEQNRRRNGELKEYTDLKAKLGDEMPYKDIGSFRRAARAGTEQYKALRFKASGNAGKAKEADDLPNVSENKGENKVVIPPKNPIIDNAEECRKKFEDLPYNSNVINSIRKEARRTITINDKQATERASLISIKNSKEIKSYQLGVFGGRIDVDETEKAETNSLVLVHNHPSGKSFSDDDIDTLNSLPQIDTIIAAGHDGTVYTLSINKRNGGKRLDNSVGEVYNISKTEHNGDLNEVLKELANKYGWRYKKL